MAVQKAKDLSRRRRRQNKTRKLKKRIARSKSESEVARLVAKLRKINPFIKPDQ